MKKNIIASVVFGLVIASFYPVEAQQPAKVRKIGFLFQARTLSDPRFLRNSVRLCVILATSRVRISY